jgi:hypothetical protein
MLVSCPELRPFLIRIERVGIVDRSLRLRLPRGWAFRNIGDRVGQGRDTASEPDPDVGSASVHRLKDGDRFGFLHSSTNHVNVSGVDNTQPCAAMASSGHRRVDNNALLAIISYGRRPGKRTLRSPICSNDKIS